MHYFVLIRSHFLLTMHISAIITMLAIASKFEILANYLFLFGNLRKLLLAMGEITGHALITLALCEQRTHL